MSLNSKTAATYATSSREAPLGAEVYGGEHLPVLITLPDLRSEDEARAEEHLEQATGGVEPSSSQPRSTPVVGVQMPAGPGDQVGDELSPRERRMRAQKQRREQRAAERGARRSPPGWVRSVSQFALAAVLAGMLLAVIVSMKGPARPAPSDPLPRAEVVPLVAPPTLEMGDSSRATTSLDSLPGPQLGPPSMLGPALELDAPMGLGEDLQSAAQAERPWPGASIRTARVLPEMTPYNTLPNANHTPALPTRTPLSTPSYEPAGTQYPSTGVEPVRTESSGPGAVRPAWSESLPGLPMRNMDPSLNSGYRTSR